MIYGMLKYVGLSALIVIVVYYGFFGDYQDLGITLRILLVGLFFVIGYGTYKDKEKDGGRGERSTPHQSHDS